MLTFVAGLLRAAVAFADAVVATVLSAPLHADPQHQMPRSLIRVHSD